MPRQTNRLTDKTIRALSEPGMHADGNGLYLSITATGVRSWVYRFRLAGRRRDMGLGALADLKLAEARTAADRARRMVRRVRGVNTRTPHLNSHTANSPGPAGNGGRSRRARCREAAGTQASYSRRLGRRGRCSLELVPPSTRPPRLVGWGAGRATQSPRTPETTFP